MSRKEYLTRPPIIIKLAFMTRKLIAAAIVGIVFGITCSRYLFVGSALSLIPWAIAGWLLGVWCQSYRESVITGATYGFLLAFTFMAAGYAGADPILGKLPFFALLGVVGAVCGVGLSVFGAFIRMKIKRER